MSFLAGASLLMGGFQSASAQSTQLDGVIQPESVEQYLLLEEFSKTRLPLTKVQTAKIAFVVTADKNISIKEKDLLVELMRTDIKNVKVLKDDGTDLSVPVANSDSAVILSYLLVTKKFDNVKQWENGPEGLAFLGIHYHINPATRNYIIKGIVKDLVSADKASNTNNAYGPLRSYLQGYKNDIKLLSGFEQAAASQMMYDIVSQLNSRKPQGGKIPGFIYSDFDNSRYAALMP